jgi:hypothetical protein
MSSLSDGMINILEKIFEREEEEGKRERGKGR